LQTSPPDTSLLRLPLAPPLPLCSALAAAARRRCRTPSSTSSFCTCPRVASFLSRSISSPLLPSRVRATMTRAVRRPPRRRRRFHVPRLSLRPLSSTQRDQESVESSFALFFPFATYAVSPFVSAASFSSPVKYGSPWAALTERSSHPLNPVVASPCLADTRQALRAP
jgi:hypothetical protein